MVYSSICVSGELMSIELVGAEGKVMQFARWGLQELERGRWLFMDLGGRTLSMVYGWVKALLNCLTEF